MSKRTKKVNYRYPLFAEAYVINGFNATLAAVTAGYAAKTAYSQGSRLLKNVEVQALISEFMDKRIMTKQETAVRLSEHARADIRPFINLNSQEISEHPLAWLIKKYKIKTRRLPGTVAILEEKVEIELHDSQSALNTFAKHHGLLKDGITINVNIDLVTQLVQAIEARGESAGDLFEEMLREIELANSEPNQS